MGTWTIRNAEDRRPPDHLVLIRRGGRLAECAGITDQWGIAPVSGRPHLVEEIAALIPSGLVAIGDGILGFIAANTEIPESFAHVIGSEIAASCLYLHTIVASRTADARGVGAALMRRVENQAFTDGRRFLVQHGFANNPKLLAYYEGVGFTRFGPATDGGQPMIKSLSKPL